jgi:hypothetical protein
LISTSTESSIDIKNILGQTLQAYRIQKGVASLEIDVSALPNGLYIIQAENSKGSIRRKFIKQ